MTLHCPNHPARASEFTLTLYQRPGLQTLAQQHGCRECISSVRKMMKKHGPQWLILVCPLHFDEALPVDPDTDATSYPDACPAV